MTLLNHMSPAHNHSIHNHSLASYPPPHHNTPHNNLLPTFPLLILPNFLILYLCLPLLTRKLHFLLSLYSLNHLIPNLPLLFHELLILYLQYLLPSLLPILQNLYLQSQMVWL